MAAKHETSLLLEPLANRVVKPGEILHLTGVFTPQNTCPTAITQIFFYFGVRGSPDKKVQKLYNGCPGPRHKKQKFDFEYTVPQDLRCHPNSIAILEIGWAQEMQYSWEDAVKNFQEKAQDAHLLLSLPVAQISEGKHDFKVTLCAPLPKAVKGGDTLVLDLATQMQNNYSNAISQLIVYVKDGTGTYHVCCIHNGIPGERPPSLRGEVAYHISESLVGQTLEIGWAFELQYTIQDAINNFNKNPKENLLGSVEVCAN